MSKYWRFLLLLSLLLGLAASRNWPIPFLREIPREETPAPSPTPIVCTSWLEGMKVRVVPKTDASITLEMEGFQPDESPIFLFTGEIPGKSSASLESRPAAVVGADGRFTWDVGLYTTPQINHWQGQVIHARGVACFGFTLPLPSSPLEFPDSTLSTPASVLPSPTVANLAANSNLGDLSDWQTLTVGQYGFAVQYPPAFEVRQWEIPDWDSYSIIESAIMGTDPQLPEIGLTFIEKPADQSLRDWFEAHTRDWTDSSSDNPMPVFFNVSSTRETEVGDYPALMFQDEGMITGVNAIIDRTDHIVWLGYPVYENYDLSAIFYALLETVQFDVIEVTAPTLDTLPFQPGTSWIYERTEYNQIPDSTDIITHTLLVTETVVSVQQQPPYTILEMRRQMPDTLFASLEEQSYWYVLDGQTLYRQDGELNLDNVTGNGRVELVFPLTPGTRWHSLPELHNSDPEGRINSWLRQVERLEAVATPAGTFAQCVYFTEIAGGNYLQTWYCPDVGFVQRRDDHAGTRFGFSETLIAVEY